MYSNIFANVFNLNTRIYDLWNTITYLNVLFNALTAISVPYISNSQFYENA